VTGGETSYRGTTFSERMKDAPCLTTDPELGYPSQDGKRGKGKETAWLAAQAVCRGCPVALRRECLEVAMAAETGGASNRHGVFGGLDPEGRALLARRREAEAKVRRREAAG